MPVKKDKNSFTMRDAKEGLGITQKRLACLLKRYRINVTMENRQLARMTKKQMTKIATACLLEERERANKAQAAALKASSMLTKLGVKVDDLIEEVKKL